jgi:hypothetical protein
MHYTDTSSTDMKIRYAQGALRLTLAKGSVL